MGVRAARQLFLVGLALALWSALARPGWLELLGCYVAALVLTELAEAFAILPSLSARAWLALGLIFSLPGLRFAYGARERIVEQAGLVGIQERVLDRMALARSIAIAPRLLSTAQPQTFFIQAQSLKEASVAFVPGKPVPAESLGNGLFRVDYDPRRDGVPKVLDGEASISIQDHTTELQVVTPLAHPRWFCRSPSGSLAATPSEETDELIVVSTTSTEPVRIPVGDGPIACDFVDEQHVALSLKHTPEVWVVDISGSQPAKRLQLAGDGGGPLGQLVFDATHNQLLIARGGAAPALLQVSWPGLVQVAETGLGVAPDLISLCGEGLVISSRADASLRAFIRREDHFIEVKQLLLGRPVAALAVDPKDARVFVTLTDYQALFSPPQLGNHFVQDQLLVIQPRGFSVMQRVLTARRSERQTKPGDVDQGGSPLGIWPLRDGRLAVTFAGTDELWRLSLPEANPEVVRFNADEFYTPQGVVELSDGTVWLSSAAGGSLAKLAPRAAAPQIVPLTPSDQKLATSNAAALARRIGEHGFYESTRAGISCQSCHMHADSDNAAYNLGDHRLIPTLSVRGMFGTSPYLRDGSYPRLADLDDVAEELYRGYVRVQPGRRYALQAYVESLPRATTSTSRDLEAEKRGYAVFQRAGCARCHAPPAFTNLGQLPLAALFPKVAAELKNPEQLDVPSLLSVSSSPPYLHDGRARTLRAVISEQNPDNQHGNTGELPDADVDDLLKFLGSL